MSWLLMLGGTLGCYLALAGADHGVAIGPWDVRSVRPYFLGNQVWIVAAVGVLIAAFPVVEGELLSGYYPPVATLLGGLALTVVSLLLGALTGASGTTGVARWSARLGALAATAGMGWLLAALLTAAVWRPAGLLGALTMIILVAAHGGAFVAWRGVAAERTRALALLRRVLPVGAGMLLLTSAAAALDGAATSRAALGWLLIATAALGTAWRLAARVPASHDGVPATGDGARSLGQGSRGEVDIVRRPVLLPALTAVVLVAPMLAVGSAGLPNFVGLPVPVTGATAGTTSLDLYQVVLAPALPLLLAVQAMGWWLLHRRRPAPAR